MWSFIGKGLRLQPAQQACLFCNLGFWSKIISSYEARWVYTFPLPPPRLPTAARSLHRATRLPLKAAWARGRCCAPPRPPAKCRAPPRPRPVLPSISSLGQGKPRLASPPSSLGQGKPPPPPRPPAAQARPPRRGRATCFSQLLMRRMSHLQSETLCK